MAVVNKYFTSTESEFCVKEFPRNKMQKNISLLFPVPPPWFIDVIINNFRRPRRRC